MVFPLWVLIFFCLFWRSGALFDLVLWWVWSRMYGLLGFEGFDLFCFVVLRFFLWCAWSVFYHQIALFWFFLSFVDSLAGVSLLWGYVFLQNYDWWYVIWHNLFVSWYYVDIQKLVRFLLVFWIMNTFYRKYSICLIWYPARPGFVDTCSWDDYNCQYLISLVYLR